MEVKSLSISKEKELSVNFFVILLFGFLNPFYATSICAVLTLMNVRINYRLFSLMFALSFTFLFFLRDWGVMPFDSDAFQYMRSYQMASDRSLKDILYQFALHPHGEEPLWQIYLWLFQKLIGYNLGLFVFLNYFIIFALTAYLGKLVGGKRFVIVIFCIISVNMAFLYNVFEVWRHTFALLLFLIGIFLFETNKPRWISRSLIYSSVFIHLVTLPLIILYEIFILLAGKNTRFQSGYWPQKITWYFSRIMIYGLIVVLILILADKYGSFVAPSFNISSIYTSYTKEYSSGQSGYYFLFNPLSYVVIFYFWVNRKQISKNDIFIGINYFAFIIGLWLLSLPSSPMGRIIYVFLVGASILSSKLILSDFRLGFICLLVIILYQFSILSQVEGAHSLKLLLNGEYINPVYGLVVMIFNYDTLLVLPGGV